MRDYGRVYTRFWSSEDVRALSDDGRLLALYLLTCEHMTLVGILRLPDGYATEDLKWPVERVSKGFAELSRNGFANRCETTKWVWVRKFLTWNAPENPNQWKAARKIVSQIPTTCAWMLEFQQVFAAAAGDPPSLPPTLSKPLENGSGTLSKPVSGSGAVSEAVSLSAPVPRETNTPEVTRAGAVCVAMKAEGMMDVTPSHPLLLELLKAGAEIGEFVDAAKRAVADGKRFAYALAIVRGQREDAERRAADARTRAKVTTAEDSEREALQKLMDRRPRMSPSLADFRDPNPGETSDQYRLAQEAEWKARQPRDVRGVAAQLARAKAVA